MVILEARTENVMYDASPTVPPKVVSNYPGRGTGDTVVVYEDQFGNRSTKYYGPGEAVSISVSKYSNSDVCYPNRISFTTSVVPEFEVDERKYWKPPAPPTNPKRLPMVREDRRAKRVVLRPEFHARSNPRGR